MERLNARRQVMLMGCAAFFTGGSAAAFVANSRELVPETMTPPEALAASQRGDILLIDIRRPDEWAATGIASTAVPIDMRQPDFITRMLAQRMHDDQPVALICAAGVRSARLTRALTNGGIGPVVDIPEGMMGSGSGPGWIARGLPITSVVEQK